MQLNRQSLIKKVLKFGGSSLGTPTLIENVIDIVLESYAQEPRIAIVVSAFGGITDQLIFLGLEAKKQRRRPALLDEIIERHIDATEKLIHKDSLSNALNNLRVLVNNLELSVLKVARIGDFSKKALDELMSFGEKMSAFILAEALKKYIPSSQLLNAEHIIVTNRTFGQGMVDFTITNTNIVNYFKKASPVTVVTGFIASSTQKEPTTLGRGGSDYTAAILGAALNSDIVELWTDVDGVMNADPKKVQSTSVIPKLSYEKAMEMSLLGAKVIHYFALLPVKQKRIPLLIKNSFHRESPGTLISDQGSDISHDMLLLSTNESLS